MLVAATARRLLGPFVPTRKRLPFALWAHRLEGNCEPELEHLDEIVALTTTAVDVGAGIGLYSYALSMLFERVCAFDCDDKVTQLISQYNSGNIRLVHCLLSDVKREGEGRDSGRLDDFSLENVGFIRIDVAGNEMPVLLGAASTIEKWRPVVLMELAKSDVENANAWFRNLDYKHCYLEDFNDVHGSASNHIYVPFERLAFFGIARPVE